jgi:anti-sigma factor RsiW
MNVPRSVVADLLPLYVLGELSPETLTFVEAYISKDPELAELLQELRTEDPLARVSIAGPRPELALRSLRRTRRLLGWQRRLFAFGLFFTLISLSFEFSFADGRLNEFHFLMRDSPWIFGSSLAVGVFCWIIYAALLRGLRTDVGHRTSA